MGWPNAALAILSAATLALEVLLTRLLAYALPIHVLYTVLAIALLGFGAAGSLLVAAPGWRSPDVAPRAVAWGALLVAGSSMPSLAAFFALLPHVGSGATALVAAALVLCVPFLGAGVVIAVSLDRSHHIGTTYAVHLLGAAVGCAAPLVLLGPLSAPRLAATLALVALVGGVIYALQVRPLPPRLGLGVAGATIVALSGWPLSERLASPPPEPAPVGQLAFIRAAAQRDGVEVHTVFDRWNATGRVEIVALDGVPGTKGRYPYLYYAQDSSAGSMLVRWNGAPGPDRRDAPRSEVARACTDTIWGQGYASARDDVLVVGLGGGIDVQCALYNRARHVDVAEINPDAVAAVRGPFDEWLGGIGSSPRVSYQVRDGRSLIAQAADASYDLVQLSGVDTKQLFASGSLAVAENTIYTLEAFDDYLRILKPGGALSVIRFGEQEGLRLASTAVAALERRGVDAAERHVAVVQGVYTVGVLVGRDPLHASEVAALAGRLSPLGVTDFGVSIYFYELFGGAFRIPPVVSYSPTSSGPETIYTGFFEAVTRGSWRAFTDAYWLDVSPVKDDRPFFFDSLRYDKPQALLYPHVLGIGGGILTIALIAAALILLPRWRLLGRSGGRARFPAVVYFACVGLAYLLVEVWLIHRFSMYLGHQTIALSIVLAGLLGSTAVGAWLGDRAGPAKRRVAAGVAGIVLLALLAELLAGPIARASGDAALPVRAALTLAFILPLGACMGLPFPAGLSHFADSDRPALPWYVGINAFSSVLSSLLAIPLTAFGGYGMTLASGLLAYSLAALTLRLAAGDARRPGALARTT